MRFLLPILATFAIGINAASINFVEAPEVKQRYMPHQSGAILSYHEAIEKSTAAIVHIATTQKVQQRMMPPIHPFFEQFFGPGFQYPQQAPKRHGLGSGVIVSKEGYIITNNHVIEKADEIVVTLPGSSKEYEAEVIGSDPGTDIAIIRIDADDLPVITVGTSSNLKVGDVVFAIGNPYGIGQTVTQGIISAQNKTGIGINKYENYIQTDASINPGNSGGALVDSRGVLIGINTAIITRSGGNHGIGFAIEIDMVKDIATKLIESGSIERGYLGVSIDNLNKSMRKVYKNDKGALITDVMPDTAAEKSGLKRGDLIIEVDGDSISDRTSLQNAIGLHTPGTKVMITFERDRKVMSLKITLGSLKEAVQARSSQQLEGVEMTELTEEVRYRFRVPSNVEGVLVTSVQPDSEAADQGVKTGDVIIQVEQYVVTNLQEISTALKAYKGDYKRVYINRGGRVFIAVLK